jgi:hypothetical protein
MQQERLIAENTSNENQNKIVFVSADYAAFFLNQFPIDLASGLTIVIHNGDSIPVEAIYRHSHKFKKIFCVNWLGDLGVAEPLPIGLENAWHGVNGRTRLFSDALPERRINFGVETRPEQVLVAFNVNTNLRERNTAAQVFAKSNLKGASLRSLSIREYHRRLRRTQFIVSPPGNGPDCHRTWEAMYCGAVPIVLESQWPFAGMEFPAFVTPSWEYAAKSIESSSDDLYLMYAERNTRSLFVETYFEKIRNSQNK